MNDHYLKKLDRVTAILTQLQSKPIVRAQDLAQKFEVSVRTIYRDVKTLENAGIPIVGEAGSGYSLMDGYKLPPVMFTKEEVLSFITAEKLMQKFLHQSLGNHYQTAMEKVRSVLKYSDKNLIENIEKQIDVYNYHPKTEDNIKNVIPIILESIAEKKQLTMEYKTMDSKISTRTIEAVGVFFEFNYWYIMAFCTLRNDFRQFRVDRILQIFKTQNPFLQEYGQINDYRKSGNGNKTTVKLLVEKKIMNHLVNSKKYYGLIDEVDTENGVELTFETEWINDGFPRWLITFADYATILEPEILQTKLNDLLIKISGKHK
ncbi:Predicted DNA-binding transcriptional regulator YafY, contains an HTH and WYL domains [Chryseobacterium wanjuense]|jgi:predicted DNA-binding transcriptional regulator YafY|uniref:Predicted DNA-binding transcriptional regulator YafY, contains an HTH and WYL domains n=1 Tax=Chryseobacterium wanjuense TaxID=356305 RepID=A0A1I0N3H4_9FLAO|nr:YafY family protein [Chryseobacterium wanjuense]SEV95399.1 Predicted DNA-binding transcriptional regulator YafY, contains an HTH and WYL domains [Chryseobacterium wanjuense]